MYDWYRTIDQRLHIISISIFIQAIYMTCYVVPNSKLLISFFANILYKKRDKVYIYTCVFYCVSHACEISTDKADNRNT